MLHYYRAVDDSLEYCFYIETTHELDQDELTTLNWLLSETFQPHMFSRDPILDSGDIVELGPRMNFETAYSTNAAAICNSCGITKISRLER